MIFSFATTICFRFFSSPPCFDAIIYFLYAIFFAMPALILFFIPLFHLPPTAFFLRLRHAADFIFRRRFFFLSSFSFRLIDYVAASIDFSIFSSDFCHCCCHYATLFRFLYALVSYSALQMPRYFRCHYHLITSSTIFFSSSFDFLRFLLAPFIEFSIDFASYLASFRLRFSFATLLLR